MVKETRFYELLEVSGTASDAQLKSAYKKGALRHHPDKNRDNPAAAEKFKDISKAYEVLSDPQKRQLYDQYGEAGLTEQGGANGMNAEDLFSQFFGGGGLGSMFGGQMRDQGPKKARTIHHIHKVALDDIYNGKVSKLALQKSVICSECSGLGGKAGAVKTCSGCNGAGMKTMMRQMGPMIQRFQTVCPDCQGEGEIIREKDKCQKCNGKKTNIIRKVLYVHVDKGVPNGHKIDFRGEGDQMPGVQPGDVQFQIEQKPHPRFRRQGDDLIYKAKIHLFTALAGGFFYIKHLDAPVDRFLKVIIRPGEVIPPDSFKMIPGQGMPSMRHHDPGNLYIQFEVVFPTTRPPLSPGELATLKKITGIAPPDPKKKDQEKKDQEKKDQEKKDQANKDADGDKMVIDKDQANKDEGGDDMVIDKDQANKDAEGDKKVTDVVETEGELDQYSEEPPPEDPKAEAKVKPGEDPKPKKPTEKPTEKPKLEWTVEDQYLEPVNPSSQDRANMATMEDDDEDGMPSGGERVQCASQ